uniref:Uncharacterized protein n=1 Tax=Arundo donax TaxID=35708 RepID=A0A0A9BRX4_ARUDO
MNRTTAHHILHTYYYDAADGCKL